MAPLLKQQKTRTSAGMGISSNGYVTSLTITPDAAFSTSGLLVLVINMSGTSAATAASSPVTGGGTWTKWTDASISGATNGTDQAIEVWTAVPSAATAATVTVNLAAAALIGLNLREYSGAAQTGFKVSAGVSADTNYVQAHTASAAGPSSNGDLVIAGLNVARANENFTGGGGSNSGSYGNTSEMKAATGLEYLSATVSDRVQSAAGVQSAAFGTAGYDKGLMFIAVVKQLINSAPTPPTDLNGTSGATTAALSWGAVPGADTYTVRRATSASGPFTAVGTNLSSSTYNDTGLTTGTTYYYTVSATNTFGESAQTAFAPLKAQAPPPVTFNDWHLFGVKPNLNATSMRQAFRTKVDQWFGYVLTSENLPGTPIPQNSRLPGPVKRIKAPDQGFYPDSNSRNGTVSEGQAYGALFCAWLSNPALAAGVYWADAKANFDSLYRYYDYHKNNRGFMNWHIYANGTPGDYNGASDGDFDMAEALRVMSVLHGDTGAINYGAECDRLLKAIEDWEFVPETGYAYANYMTNGDNWGFNTDSYMADYFRSGFMREWRNWLASRGRADRAARWDRILQVNYDHIDTRYISDPTWSAGVPDRQTRTGGTIDGDFNNQVTYNSVRLGFGMMVDYLWHGTDADPRAKQFMDKIANRFKTVFTTGGNVKAPNYSRDLSSYQGYANASGTGYALSVSLGLIVNQTFATELFNAAVASNEPASSYFNGGILCYAMGVASGAAQPFVTADNSTGNGGDPGTGTGGGTPGTPAATSKKYVMLVSNGTSWDQASIVTTAAST